MPIRRIKIVEPIASARGPRTSDTADLAEQFPGTPYLNDYNDAAALALMNEVLSNTVEGNPDFEQGASMTYENAPSIPSEVIAAGHDQSIANGFLPNTRTPRTGNPADFAGWEGMKEVADAMYGDQFPVGHGGVGSQLDPAVSSAAIGDKNIEDYLGSSGPTT